MNNSNPLKFNDDTKTLVLEISALSGIPQNVVKEVLEYMIVDWAVKLADHPDQFVDLTIPYMGSVGVKYSGDTITPSGDLSTEVESFITFDDGFRKLVGDIHDEGMTELVPILQKKIEQAVLVASNSTAE